MAQEFNNRFYRTKAWKKCRAGYISYRQSIDGGMCERCGDALGYEVHHIIWLTPENSTDPNITLSWDNLRYLCHNCHTAVHDDKDEPILREGFEFDGDGNIVHIPP